MDDEWAPKLQKWSWWRDDLPNLLSIAWYFIAAIGCAIVTSYFR
jgi:hypothetical protein